ncbi:voltage-gated potassium channel Kch [Prescottella agglutinans]|uniref:Voltage-gated potassium channel Kch n=1 Tax=Prescottella agglutinans TaxID=1644129 RepID=A0ABT6M4F5_9NOCA|nr:voltage-gated potassium channel Kch [Prescottella agglutinans]
MRSELGLLSDNVTTVAQTPKSLVSKLSKRGPHRVLRGDLALAGQPGVVYTPAEGFNLPAVAFAHDWLAGAANYAATFEHLASWGIVVAAPSTERGPVPSHLGLAADLGTSLDICTGVRLGPGRISVHPERVAFAGHGMGAGVAVLAAAQQGRAKAVAALFPAPTAPSAVTAAAKVEVPGLILAGATDVESLSSDAVALDDAWKGESLLRVVDKGSSTGLVEGRRLLGFLGVGGAERRTQHVTRALLTGFLLRHLTDDKMYAAFSDPDAHLPGTHPVTREDEEGGEHTADPKDAAAHHAGAQISQLLSR